MLVARALAARTSSPVSKLVLVVLARMASTKAGEITCMPVPSQVADMAGIDSEQLQRAMVDLVRLELVSDTGDRSRDRMRHAVYQLHLPEVDG